MKSVLLALGLGFAFTVMFTGSASAATNPYPNGRVYINPDQAKPMTEFSQTLEFYNSTPDRLDSVYVKVPCGQANMYLYSATPAPDYVGNGGVPVEGGCMVQWGKYAGAPSINLAKGGIFKVTLTVGIGQVLMGSPPQPNPDPTATDTGLYEVGTVHYPTFGDTRSYQLAGNKTFTVTPNPVPTPRPLDFAVNNEYSQGLNSIGIGDTSAIRGLFPPGPVDSLILIPINLVGQLISAIGDPELAPKPTLTFWGTSVTFVNGQMIYQNLGSTVSALVAVGINFFILFAWVTSLFHRLERASTFATEKNDAWGQL